MLKLVEKAAPYALNEFESCDLKTMQNKLAMYERNRALWVWSDHSVLERLWISTLHSRSNL